MTKIITKKATSQIQKLSKMLSRARTKHDDKIIEVEKIWAKLKPADYKKRELLVKVTDELIKIEKSLNKREQKLKN